MPRMYSMTMHGPCGSLQRGVVKGDGVGVLEAGHQQRFALEALAELGVGGDVVVHDLDDDLPAEVELPGQVDAAHAAFAEQPDGFVPAEEDAAHHALVAGMLRVALHESNPRRWVRSGPPPDDCASGRKASHPATPQFIIA